MSERDQMTATERGDHQAIQREAHFAHVLSAIVRAYDHPADGTAYIRLREAIDDARRLLHEPFPLLRFRCSAPENSVTDSDERERILSAFRATTMYREAIEPMRQALVQADSYLSLIGHRHAHTLPPDLRREVLDCSLLCRRLSESDDRAR